MAFSINSTGQVRGPAKWSWPCHGLDVDIESLGDFFGQSGDDFQYVSCDSDMCLFKIIFFNIICTLVHIFMNEIDDLCIHGVHWLVTSSQSMSTQFAFLLWKGAKLQEIPSALCRYVQNLECWTCLIFWFDQSGCVSSCLTPFYRFLNLCPRKQNSMKMHRSR